MLRPLLIEVYGIIISNLSSECSTLRSLLLASKSLSVEAIRALFIHTLKLKEIAFFELAISFVSATDLNAVFRATSGLELLFASFPVVNGFTLVEIMQGVTFELKALHWAKCMVDAPTIALLSSSFGRRIVDLKVKGTGTPVRSVPCSERVHVGGEIASGGALRVSDLTVESTDRARRRRVRRLCADSISASSPLDLSYVKALSDRADSMLEPTQTSALCKLPLIQVWTASPVHSPGFNTSLFEARRRQAAIRPAQKTRNLSNEG